MNMISTGAFLPEMDASNKQETMAEKFARVWEKKNSKVARAGGVSLMALSLAACGSSSDTTTTAATPTPTPTPDPEPTTPVGQAFTLTDEKDTIIGTSGNDTITATTATLGATDLIVDDFSNDSDVLNLTVTGALAAGDVAAISGIENVNLTWDAFGTLTADVTDIAGAAITVASSKLGFIGNAQVNVAGDNTIIAGAGVDTSLDVNGGTSVSVQASEGAVTVDGSGTDADDVSASVTGGTTITVGAAEEFVATTATANANTTDITVTAQQSSATVASSATITGGAATTDITATEARTTTVDAGAATTVVVAATAADTTASSATITALSGTSVTVDGTADDADTADITLGAAEVDLDIGNTTAIETVSVTTAADSAVTLVAGAQLDALTLTSSGAVTLLAASSADLDGVEVTNATAGLTVDLTSDAGTDLSSVAATLFDITTSSGHALSFATGANISVAADVALNAGQTLNVADGTRSTTDADVLNIAIAGDQADIETTNVETTNITATFDAATDADNTDDEALTLGTVIVDGDLNLTSDATAIITEIDAGTSDVVLNIAGDLTLTATGVTAGSIDMAGVTGDAAILQAADANISVVGAVGANTVETIATAASVEMVSGAGDDDVTLATDTGDAVLQLGDGDNTVSAVALVSGNLVVIGGSGDDSVDLGDLMDAAIVNLQLGDGDNLVDIGDAADDFDLTVVAGAGDDTILISNDLQADAANDITLGTGTNILDLSAGVDIKTTTGIDFEISGISVIETDGTSEVDASVIDGQTLEIKSDGTNGGIDAGFDNYLIAVEARDSQEIDLANITANSTLADGARGVDLTTANGTNTVTGSGFADDITGGTGADTIDGGAGNDVIAGGAGNDTLTGGEGDDTISSTGGTNTFTGGLGKDAMTGGTGVDTFVIASADTGATVATADSVTGFTTTTDFLKLGVAGTATNYATADGALTEAAALANANTAMDGTVKYYLETGIVADLVGNGAAADAVLFVDADMDGTADDAILMVGITAGDLVAADIIA